MKKKTISILSTAFLAVIFSNNLSGQVGINTESPKATFDVVGKPTDNNSLDGIIPPRITAEQLNFKTYTSEQTGAFIYVSEPLNAITPTTQTVLVVEKGYYLFDGVRWIPFKNTDTLYDVVQRGNFAGRFISFTGDAITKQGTRDAGLGYNPTTRAFYFGNLNVNHTGRNNVTYGAGTGALITTAYSNSIFGNDAGKSITTAFENSLFGKDAGGNLQVGMWNVSVGESAMMHATDATFTTSVGDGSAMNTVGRLYNNTSIGANSFKFSSGKNNTSLGTASGLRVEGDNNVFIGSGAGNYQLSSSRVSLNNKLFIHSQQYSDNGSNGGGGTYTESIGTNSLVYGDFKDRWFRLNGKFEINPSYINVADATYDKVLLHNSITGAVGVQNYIQVPSPPTTGAYTLHSVNGVMQWEAN